ncbi:MAG: M28 family peptidase [Gemmatimonadetes bacterium]|nr:M28 family peptidase [Gemmatimonadota bacterium]
MDWPDGLFRRVAVPRLPGSQAVRAVEDLIVDRLVATGYRVERQAFRTSVARLRAVGVVGAGLGWCALAFFPLFVLPFPGYVVAATGAAALAMVALVAVGVARRRPSETEAVAATNIIATRSATPACWLVAHSDSKAQKLSLRGRVVAFAALGLGTLGLVVCLIIRVAGPLPVGVVAPWILFTLAGGAAMAVSWSVGDSPGAVDNASGIIAVLVAAELARHRSDIGVLITGAEEYGMEGSRAWTAAGAPRGVFVNFDGLDDRGAFTLMRHDPARTSASPEAVSGVAVFDAVSAALTDDGHGLRRSRLPLGIFVDGSVLAAAGMPGVTLSRGDWRTLGVVHTERDTADRAGVRSAVEAGRLVARAVDELLG